MYEPASSYEDTPLRLPTYYVHILYTCAHARIHTGCVCVHVCGFLSKPKERRADGANVSVDGKRLRVELKKDRGSKSF